MNQNRNPTLLTTNPHFKTKESPHLVNKIFWLILGFWLNAKPCGPLSSTQPGPSWALGAIPLQGNAEQCAARQVQLARWHPARWSPAPEATTENLKETNHLWNLPRGTRCCLGKTCPTAASGNRWTTQGTRKSCPASFENKITASHPVFPHSWLSRLKWSLSKD